MKFFFPYISVLIIISPLYLHISTPRLCEYHDFALCTVVINLPCCLEIIKRHYS
ncbi:hypothetical protein BO79DRAFT_66981, partial [Aspergillus costaricaensis CBS 115574]